MEENGTDQLEYYLSSLNELSEILIDADRVESVGTGILRLTLGTVMASKGAIFLYNKNKDISILSKRGFDLPVPLFMSSAELDTLKNHKHGHLMLPIEDKGHNGETFEHLTKEKAKIALPLFHKNNFLGLLCVGSKFMGEKYSSVDIKILEIIAGHLTKALYNYQLLNEVEKKKTEINLKLLQLETLFDISVAISSVLDVEELCEDVLWRSVGILNASKGVILLQSEGSPILNPLANFNWVEDIPMLSKKLAIFKSIDENKIGEVFTENQKKPIQKKLGEQNLIIAPISAKNKTQGYMILCNKETRKGIEPFSATDLDLLTALCNQAAVAMENAKLFKEITKEKQFNESILGSIATGVITLDNLGEVDSINSAGLKILKTEKDNVVGNHYMYLFEKDEELLELIANSEIENKVGSELGISLNTVSKDTVINASVSPRLDPEGNKQGSVIALEDISDVSKVKNTFKRYVSKQVVDELLGDDGKLNLGGEQREVTILFTDIRGFTSMSEKMKPERVVTTLNEYFSDMIDIVFKNNGTLDKIIGDELMVLYGAPISGENDTVRAVETAVEMQHKIKELNIDRKKRKEPPILVGAGINKGLVVSGNIGSRDLMDYTVIGDTVNVASRLCAAAGPGEIMVSSSVYGATKKEFSYDKLEPIKVKGKEKKVPVFLINDKMLKS
ncbi:MAG: hypothetical protein CMG23_05545 [Candidatus Marinimicrobia bacterium]|nr:hypothetical protein [Candidatus Neomarinimicrobiota bacterium]